jgi:hypothetical protein
VRPIIGLDLGYSKAKKSCGLVTAACTQPLPGKKKLQGTLISGSMCRLDELLAQFRQWRAADALLGRA